MRREHHPLPLIQLFRDVWDFAPSMTRRIRQEERVLQPATLLATTMRPLPESFAKAAIVAIGIILILVGILVWALLFLRETL